MNSKDLKIWSISGKLFFSEDQTTYKVVTSEIVAPMMEKAKDLFKRTFLAESQKNVVTLLFYDDSCIEITEDLSPSEVFELIKIKQQYIMELKARDMFGRIITGDDMVKVMKAIAETTMLLAEYGNGETSSLIGELEKEIMKLYSDNK